MFRRYPTPTMLPDTVLSFLSHPRPLIVALGPVMRRREKTPQIQKEPSRRCSRFLAVALTALALLVWAEIAQAKRVKYDLAPGESTPEISIPENVPVRIVGVQTNFGFRGIGSVDVLSIPGPGGFIEWVGLHSTAGATITEGFSGAAGTLILFLDFSHCVQLEVAGVAGSSQVAVHNTCGVPAAGVLKITR